MRVSTLERESVGDPSDLNPAFFDRATRACRWVEGRAPERRCSAPLDEDAGDAVPGQTVPQRRGFPACAIGSVEGTLFDRVGIGAHEPVGAHRDRDGPFGVLPQRQARDPEDGRLLLDPTRVREDELRPGNEGEEVHIAEGFQDLDEALDTSIDELLPSPRVKRCDERHELRDSLQPFDQALDVVSSSTFDGR